MERRRTGSGDGGEGGGCGGAEPGEVVERVPTGLVVERGDVGKVDRVPVVVAAGEPEVRERVPCSGIAASAVVGREPAWEPSPDSAVDRREPTPKSSSGIVGSRRGHAGKVAEPPRSTVAAKHSPVVATKHSPGVAEVEKRGEVAESAAEEAAAVVGGGGRSGGGGWGDGANRRGRGPPSYVRNVDDDAAVIHLSLDSVAGTVTARQQAETQDVRG